MNTRSWTCPFCPLRCHDVVVSESTEQPALAAVEESECALAAQRLRHYQQQRVAWSAESGMPDAVGTDSAMLRVAVERILAARQVHIGGEVLDLQTARSVVRFAAEQRAVLEPVETKASDLLGPDQVGPWMEREGAMMTTLGEVAARADSLVLLGEVEAAYPRLGKRCFESHDRDAAKRIRRVESGNVERVLRTVLRDMHGPPGGGSGVGGSVGAVGSSNDGGDEATANDWRSWLDEARSIAWFWAPGALSRTAMSMLWQLSALLAERCRSAVVPLSQNASLTTASLWLTRFAPPVDFRSGEPRPLEPTLWKVRDEQSVGEKRVRIWLQPHPDAPEPPGFEPPGVEPPGGVDGERAVSVEEGLIVIGCPAERLRRRAEVVLPASLPGWDASGSTIRGDGTITLAWQPVTATDRHPEGSTAWPAGGWPSAGEWLEQLTADVAVGRTGVGRTSEC